MVELHRGSSDIGSVVEHLGLVPDLVELFAHELVPAVFVDGDPEGGDGCTC